MNLDNLEEGATPGSDKEKELLKIYSEALLVDARRASPEAIEWAITRVLRASERFEDNRVHMARYDIVVEHFVAPARKLVIDMRKPSPIESIIVALGELTRGGTNITIRDEIILLLRIIRASRMAPDETLLVMGALLALSRNLSEGDRSRGPLNDTILELDPTAEVPPFTHPGNEHPDN